MASISIIDAKTGSGKKRLDLLGQLTYFSQIVAEDVQRERIFEPGRQYREQNTSVRRPAMTIRNSDSRRTLLLSAGELFADQGYDSVTTRAISETAGVRLSAIHYHFGTKENLYLEAFRYAYEKERRIDFLEILAKNPEKETTPEGLAEIVEETVRRYFRNIFDPQRSSWEARLLVREVVNPSTALPVLAQTFMQTTVIGSEKFCRMVKPQMTDRQAAIWADTLFSHAFFYMLAAKPIAMVRGTNWLNRDFYDAAATMIARFMIRELDLPLPKTLRADPGD